MPETIIATGIYTIENVDRRNDVFLADDGRGTLVAGSSEDDADPPPEAHWKVTRLRNGRYHFSPAAQRNMYASWPTGLRQGSEIVTSPTPHHWVVTQTRDTEKFVISHVRHQLYWGIEDDEAGTPVRLRHAPTGSGNQWRFHRLSSTTVTPPIAIESQNMNRTIDCQTVTVPAPSQPKEVDGGQPASATPVVPQTVIESLTIDGGHVDSPTATMPDQSQTREVIEATSAAVIPQDVVESPNVEKHVDNQTATIPTRSEMRDVHEGQLAESTSVIPQNVVEPLAVNGSSIDSQAVIIPNRSLTKGVEAMPAAVVPQGVIEPSNIDESTDSTEIIPPPSQTREVDDGQSDRSTPVVPQSVVGSLTIDRSTIDSQTATTSNQSQMSEVVAAGSTSVVPQSVIESLHINGSPDCQTETNPTQGQTREEVNGRPDISTPIVPQSVIRSQSTDQSKVDGQPVSAPSQSRNVANVRPAVRHTLEGHTREVTSVAFSPDGKQIVSGSYDRTIRVWDVRTRKLALKPIEGHTAMVQSVAFSPDSKRIVSGSTDKTVRIWDGQSGTLAWTLNGHSDWVRSVACSPDGKRIVSGSDDQAVRVWDVETGGLVLGPLLGHTDYVYSVNYSSDGKQFLSSSRDDTVRMWDAETGHAIRTFRARSPIWSATFSPDSNQIVSGVHGGYVEVWDVRSGDSIILQGHRDTVWSVGFSPDGDRIVSAGKNGQIIVWDAKLGKAIGSLEGHNEWVASVQFSPDGKWIVSGSIDKTVRIWEADKLDAVPA